MARSSDEAALHGLQFIEADGEKRFLTGSRVSGCYFLIGEPHGALCIAEGSPQVRVFMKQPALLWRWPSMPAIYWQ